MPVEKCRARKNRPVFDSSPPLAAGINCDDGDGMPRSALLERAAELLGVSRRTVYYRIRDGRLRTVRTMNGSQRVLLDSIAQLLREEVGDNGVADDASGADLTDPQWPIPGEPVGTAGRGQ